MAKTVFSGVRAKWLYLYDEYIALFPDDVREILEQVRQIIRQAALTL
ncbi:hypothetical protein SPSYN_02205 [Sporotomaculum syntrophicum]|uniref:Uncharacterized protein n=1 Tax=Sporotomaculum syntrophicum TaxID=182264 RepID=A0A9D2WNG6_9FIRM|nr:hypothetical protein [Sporotomaculum syntrophicum]KAF1084428.1 hypothetical protein SPSYN_02205 [Sporotomaculum syntrophicum]